MPYKTIAVFLDARPSSDVRFALAEGLAREHRASILGVFVHLPPVMHRASGSPDSFVRGAGLGAFADRMTGADRSGVAAARERFATFSTEHGLATNLREITLEARGRDVVPICRFADVVVLGTPQPIDPSDRPFGWSSAEIVLAAGVPSIVVPERSEHVDFDGTAIVAWNATRESRRAVSDALPLLAAARSVVVLTFDPGGGPPGAANRSAGELVEFLAAHGISAVPRVERLDGWSPGEAIVNALSDAGVRLLVAGAYGHSRITELVLGSTTRHVLAETPVPLLLSH